MSPFPKQQKWLPNAEAAQLLGVDVRTIKRWVRQPDKRQALGAVRNGKQWRIPVPSNLQHWESDTRWNFKKLGAPLIPGWRHDLRKIARQTTRYMLEANRFWLAAYMTRLERGPVTPQDRQACLRLRDAACKILAFAPLSEMVVDRHKLQFPGQLASMGLDAREAQDVMRYWPKEQYLKHVHDAHTVAQLEVIRQRVDYWQAALELEQIGENPTTENIRPLLHKEMVAHINDTREHLDGEVIRHPTPKDTKRLMLASVHDSISGRKTAQLTFDFRLPQVGLTRRTAQKRYPQRQKSQQDIRATVFGIDDRTPGADQRLHIGKTPRRGSTYRKGAPG